MEQKLTNPTRVVTVDSLARFKEKCDAEYGESVVEGYLYNGKFYKEAAHTTEIPAAGGKIYVDIATENTYRWNGTAYVVVSDTLELGETSSTAYRGDRGKIAYDHSQSAHARTDATKTEASSTNGNIKINGTETTVYTHPGSGTNPHGTTKSDVGLGNVGNFKAVSTEASQGLSSTEQSNARANIGAGTSSFSGSYNDLSNKPTLGTAAAKDVPSSGNATTSQVVMGNDSRLSDSRPASDVSSWAKASSKPSYTKSEVGLGNVTNDAQVKRTEMGANNGVATLDENGKVPSSQLPSYVDDVIEGYYYNSKFYKESAHTTEITGESGKIYVDLSTEKTYRWSGTAFAVISETLALGETSSTAYRGDRGKTAYDHSQSTHARTDATNVAASSTNGNIKINGTETTVYTHPSGTNPHGTTKSDVGLGNVGNFKAVSTVASQGLSDTEKSNARANIGAGTSSFSGSYNDLSNKPTIPAAAANGTFSVKTKVGDASSVTAADFTANQSSADDVTFVQGSNVTLTTDTTNRTITIAAKDTTYSAATTSAAGLMSADDKTKLNGIATGATNVTTDTVSGWGYTKNAGTVTGVKVNGTTKSPSGGVVDIGTVITSHQDISGKVDTTTTVNGHALSGNVSVTKSDVGLGNVGNFKAVSTVASQGLTDTEKSNARANIGAGTSSFSGSYNDLSSKPTLGTAAAKDVPSSGNATTSQVVMGNDSRLSDSRPASDVSSWAKASSKPSYTKSEVGLGNVTNDAQVKRTEMGANNGVATLDENGKVPSSQLPSYVDDIIEGYYYNSKFYKESSHTTEITGETGKIYLDLATEKIYRWSGTAYVVISETLALGETSSTAYRGDRGKTAYDHSQSTHARTDATNVAASSTNGNIKINGTETTVYTHPSGTNPHGTTKSDVGLGNVGNFKAVSTVASQGLSDTEKSNARANIGAGTSSFSGSYNDLSNKPTIPAAAANGTFSVKTKVGDASAVTAADFTANQSSADDVTFVQGSNVTLTTDTTNRTITIAAKDTTYSAATTSAAGLMSADDKTKLNGIATGATNVTTDTVSGWGYTKNAGTVTGVKVNGTTKSPSGGIVDIGTVITSHQDISGKVDTTTTVNGHALSGNVSVTKSDVGLGNVGNFKAVSTEASQGLSSTEQSNARANIGAGTSSFSGSYNDLSNKPTIPAAAANGTFSVKTKVGDASAVTAADFTANQSSADDVTFVQGSNVTLTTDTSNRTITIAAKDTTYSAATTSAAGLMSADDKTKLNGIASGATNVTTSTVAGWGYTKNAGTVTQVKVGSTAYDPSSGVVSLPAYPTSLPASDVYSWAKASSKPSYTKSEVGLGNVTNDAQVKRTEMGANNGVATLDANGKVPSSQLPSYVDDVIEGYYYNSKFYKESAHTTEITGESGKIYVDLSTEKTYRWSGTAFVVISETLALGETSSTAYRGDRGKIAYDHSQSTHARTDATNVAASSTNGNIKINGTETTVYTHPSGTNPHGTTKSDVGLGNVGNFKAVSTVASQGLSSTEQSNARANIGAGTSSFSGSYNDLSNKPTIPAAAANGTFSIKTKVGSNNAVVASDFTANQSSADDVTFIQGSNVTLTTDTTNRTITIASTNTTYSTATTSANGLMSSTDKSKLDGIASGATAVSSSTVSGWGFTKNTGTVTQVKIGTTAYDPSSGVISLPAYPTDTNTHRPIQVNGTEVLGNNTTALNLKAGSNVSITNSSGTVTITSTDTNTWRPVGTGASDAAAGNHTHGITLASDSGTSSVSLAANTKYKLTAGGQSIIFTTPADNNTTYSSQAAASGGTAVSLCTTGEKYTWNSKQNALTFATTATCQSIVSELL